MLQEFRRNRVDIIDRHHLATTSQARNSATVFRIFFGHIFFGTSRITVRTFMNLRNAW
jgi:hypothetical protein